jgi:hypothetical protein
MAATTLSKTFLKIDNFSKKGKGTGGRCVSTFSRRPEYQPPAPVSRAFSKVIINY